jgi:hypothetical protein
VVPVITSVYGVTLYLATVFTACEWDPDFMLLALFTIGIEMRKASLI